MSSLHDNKAEKLEWARLISNLKRFYKYVKPYKKHGLLAVVFMLLATLLQLPAPLVTRYIIDKVLTGVSVLSIQMVGLLLVGLLILTMAVNILSTMLSGIFRERIIRDLQVSLFRYIIDLPMPFHLVNQPGYLLSRIGNDTGSVQGFLAETAFTTLSNVFLFVAGVIAIFALNYKLALGCLAFIPPYLLAIKLLSRRIRKASNEQQETVGRVWGKMSEALDSVFTIKAFSSEDPMTNKVRGVLNEQVRINLNFLKLNVIFGSMTGGISGLVNAYALTFGGLQVIQGNFTLGSLVAFLSYVGYVFGPIRSLSDLASRLQVSVVCLERIFSIFDQPTEYDKRPFEALQLSNHIKMGDIIFDNVSFSYDNDLVLKNVSLEIPQGSRVAFVGRSGSGKTTAAMLLMKMFDGYSGTITLNGKPLRDIPIKSLRTVIAIVPQDISLFSDTILENIRLGRKDSALEDVMEACRMANISEFIEGLDEGFDTQVGRDGARLSGGEKQRLAIARALVRAPQLMIFDEATSDLDAESEELITNAIRGMKRDHSMLIIAHRLATVRDVDIIYLFDRGRVIARGTHEELIEQNDLYRELCRKQFGMIPKATA